MKLRILTPVIHFVRFPPRRGGQSQLGMGQMHGSLAQLVEQRTENPCVTGSIPVGATICPFFHLGMPDLPETLHAYFIFGPGEFRLGQPDTKS